MSSLAAIVSLSDKFEEYNGIIIYCSGQLHVPIREGIQTSGLSKELPLSTHIAMKSDVSIRAGGVFYSVGGPDSPRFEAVMGVNML